MVVFIGILAYFLGTLWFLVTKFTTQFPDEFTFYNVYGMAEYSDGENLIIVVYYLFTTLSTVGFGDYNPKSEIERVIVTFILIIGVATFSWIMSQFIDTLQSVQNVTATNEDSERLAQFLLVLKNFNNNKPLPTDISREIEQYFTYYWANDKNYVVQAESDQDILRELPIKLQSSIYKDFLFKDFLESFHVHFSFAKSESLTKTSSHGLTKFFEWDDKVYSDFMINVLQCLEPRYYEQTAYIFMEGEEVDEMIYVMQQDARKPIDMVSQYAIGFTHNSGERYFHVRLGPRSIICGYENLFGHRAEFTYKCLMPVEAYSIRKSRIIPILDDEQNDIFKKQYMEYTLDYYDQVILRPMLKFKLRVNQEKAKAQEREEAAQKVHQEQL